MLCNIFRPLPLILGQLEFVKLATDPGRNMYPGLNGFSKQSYMPKINRDDLFLESDESVNFPSTPLQLSKDP